MRKIIYFIISAIVTLSACDKDPEIGGTAMEKMAGDWFVKAYDAEGNALTGYASISTYNTTANSVNEMWFDDGFWATKFKIPVDLTAMTFAGTEIQNSDPEYDVQITVANGKIMKNTATAPGSKTKTDSIYYEVQYSDDPGTVYYMSGYKRTGFLEDEH